MDVIKCNIYLLSLKENLCSGLLRNPGFVLKIPKREVNEYIRYIPWIFIPWPPHRSMIRSPQIHTYFPVEEIMTFRLGKSTPEILQNGLFSV